MKINFRKPRTTAEAKANERDEEFVRTKRRPKNLPNSYDDITVRLNKVGEVAGKKKKKKRDL